VRDEISLASAARGAISETARGRKKARARAMATLFIRILLWTVPLFEREQNAR
jgi:hypothetical protein